MAIITDTSVKADLVWTRIFREMPIQQKWLILGREFRTARQLHTAGYLSRHLDCTADEVVADWLKVCYGVIPRSPTLGPSMNGELENLKVLRQVIAVLQKLEIDYALGGSMASSLHGIPRFTLDADLTVEPFSGEEGVFCASFGPEFYVDVGAVQLAVQQRSSFNVIHSLLGFKVDIFVRKERPFELSAMQRKSAVDLPDMPGHPISILTAEDIVLHKLEWYRLGGDISDRQWSDLVGVLKTQAERMDEGYLTHWAAELRVADLLTRARTEARLGRATS